MRSMSRSCHLRRLLSYKRQPSARHCGLASPWYMRRDPIIRNALAIGVATGAYAVSFGVLSVAAGLSVAQTCAMSALVFTGASQFAAVGVLGAGGNVLAALAPALLLAARNALY